MRSHTFFVSTTSLRRVNVFGRGISTAVMPRIVGSTLLCWTRATQHCGCKISLSCFFDTLVNVVRISKSLQVLWLSYHFRYWAKQRCKTLSIMRHYFFYSTIYVLLKLSMTPLRPSSLRTWKLSCSSPVVPSRVARWPVFHQPGRLFTANLAEGGILKTSAWRRHFENKRFAATAKRTNAELLKL